jgi:plastocyanin
VSAALHILAAGEPSKVPFYVAGGLLAAWAVLLAAYGLSRDQFPASVGQQRAVIGVSLLLVVATMTAAVATSSKHHNEGEQKAEAAEPHGQEPAAPGVDTTKATPPGPSGAGGGGGGGATVQIAADPGQLKYDKTTAQAKAGNVTIDFNNPSPIQHDVTVEENGKKLGGTKIVANGKASAKIDLKAGTYTFYCSVDAHRQAGMEGKLTVS